MSGRIRGDDFTDEEIRGFFGSVKGLAWTAIEAVSPEVASLADAFAQMNPKPTPEEFRRHVEHAGEMSRGWDHPHDKTLIRNLAVEAFYTHAWLKFLQSATPQQPLDLTLSVIMSFRPLLSETPPEPA